MNQILFDFSIGKSITLVKRKRIRSKVSQTDKWRTREWNEESQLYIKKKVLFLKRDTVVCLSAALNSKPISNT